MLTATQSLNLLRWLRRVMVVILIIVNLAAVTLAGAAPAQQDTQPQFPIRAAFYYPWFPEAWNQQGFNPFTNYTPSLGFYDASQTVTQQHIAAMQYGGIQAGIASWWGQGSRTDTHIPGLLQAAAGTNFRWSIYHENESQGDPSVAQLTSDLTYIRDRYGNDPSFLRVNGRFVVFVYAAGNDTCGMADRWKQANTVNAYIVLKVFPGYRNCASQPDSWHQYSPAVATDNQQGYSYAIAPGFWKKGDAVRLARDLNRWHQNVRDMVASGAPWQLIATFNEWGEGTSVESAREWETASGYGAYLDALHNNGNGAPTQPTPTTVPPTQTPQPTATSVPPTATPTNTQAPNLPSTSTPTSTASPMPSPTNTTPPNPGGDPVIAAAGDIACSPSNPSYNGGNGTASSCRMKATSDLLVNAGLSAVLPLGDSNNEDGSLWIYEQSYGPTWGRVKDITRPAAGNHDYLQPGARDYYTYFGAAAGDKTKGYYSFNVGAWHIIALNSNCSQVGGCGVGSPQEQWLKADLAANQNMCTLAYWHHPRFSSGQHGSNTSYDVLWKTLYAAGVELVMNGHDHIYERYNPQSPSAVADPKGIQQFIVGTGGKNHTTIVSVQANSAVRNTDSFGVLKLTLHPTSYDWKFVPEAGKTFTDSGSRNCFTPSSTPPPAATPTNTVAPNLPPTPTPLGTSVPGGPSVTFKPVADSYVTAAIPNTNYGGSQQLRVDASPIVNGYLRFNVQGINAPIASAKLRIFANSSSSTGIKVFGVSNNTWVENTITYNNAPTLGSQSGSVGGFAGGTWVTIDITPLITGNGVFNMAITGVNATAISLASREAGANAPQLIITTR